MAKYLTPAQFRAADPGLPELANPALLSDVTLARYIARAESLIDSWIGFDTQQGGGFEPHTIGVYQQAFDYGTRRTRFPLPIVPIRQILRYRIHISNSTDGTPLVATLSPNDCIINEYDGYIEVVPLTAVTYAVSPVIAQLGLTEPIAQLDCAVGYYLASFGEALQDTGDHKTYLALRGFWATSYVQALHVQPLTVPPIPAVVYLNGVAQTSGYTLNTTEGSVTFSTAQAASAAITADYTYTIPDAVRDGAFWQVLALLGERRLAQQGLTGLEFARNGDVQIKRHVRASATSGPLDTEVMAPNTMRLLSSYKSIPIG